MTDLCVGEPLVFGDEVYDIHAETRNPLVQPEAQDIADFLSDEWCFPVKIGLEWTEEREIVLIRLRVIGPGRLCLVKEAAPVIRWLPIALGVILWLAPDVPVSSRAYC